MNLNFIVSANNDGWSTQASTFAEVDGHVANILENNPDEEITITVEVDAVVRKILEAAT